MNRFKGLLFLSILALAAPALGGSSPDRTRKLGTPVRYRNLVLFPVYDSAARARDRYRTMDEGLKLRTLKVRERQGGGEVNSVFVTNSGKKAIYLMSGEVILGGQQDRVIGDDTIVPPQARNVPVRVYCVEHGRWSGRREFDETAAALAAPSVRNTAQEGAFMAQVAERPGMAVAAPAARPRIQVQAQAAAGRAQQEVWDKVAAKNQAFGAAPATGTYRMVVNQSEGRSASSVKPYLSNLNSKFPRSGNLVGVVAGVNGKVVASDVFGDPALFRKLWPKLLRSYAVEAAESASRPESSRPVAAADAHKFVYGTLRSRDKTEMRSALTANERYEAKDARGYRLIDRGGAAGAFGPVHESVIRK